MKSHRQTSPHPNPHPGLTCDSPKSGRCGPFLGLRHILPDKHGFTLMEVVAVLIVIGIITAFAVGRGNSEGVELKVRTEVFKTHLRHAQLRALNAGDYWGIATNTAGTEYWLFHYKDTTGTQHLLPGEDAVSIDLSEEGTSISAGIYSFDERGIPYFAAQSGTPPGPALTANQEITVTKDSTTETFQIIQHTGFIQ